MFYFGVTDYMDKTAEDVPVLCFMLLWILESALLLNGNIYFYWNYTEKWVEWLLWESTGRPRGLWWEILPAGPEDYDGRYYILERKPFMCFLCNLWLWNIAWNIHYTWIKTNSEFLICNYTEKYFILLSRTSAPFSKS